MSLFREELIRLFKVCQFDITNPEVNRYITHVPPHEEPRYFVLEYSMIIGCSWESSGTNNWEIYLKAVGFLPEAIPEIVSYLQENPSNTVLGWVKRKINGTNFSVDQSVQ